MPLNLDPLLLSQEDFAEFRDISPNIDVERLRIYIRESQIKELRSFLGDTLYLALISDYNEGQDSFTEARFTSLWFGVDYTINGNNIRFHGLKPSIIYYSYARFLKNQQLNVTRYGVKHLTSEQSEDETLQQVRTKVNDANSYGLIYQNDAEAYLDESVSQYPEWRQHTRLNREEKKTGFHMTRLSPNRRNWYQDNPNNTEPPCNW